MQNIIGSLAASFGIPPQIATAAVGGLTSLVLQRSKPKAAEGLLNSLPKDVTDQFSDEDKKNFTTKEANTNINRYDLLKKLSELTGIKDIDKLDDFADAVGESIKKNTTINTADGLSEEELFSAVKDLRRDHLSQG